MVGAMNTFLVWLVFILSLLAILWACLNLQIFNLEFLKTKFFNSSEKGKYLDFSGCGVEDRYSTLDNTDNSYCAWEHSPVTWYLENAPENVSYSDCENIIIDAFDNWKRTSSLETQKATNFADADIRIGFYSSQTFPDVDQKSAIAYYPCSSDEENKGRVVFNTAENWKLSERSRDGGHSKLFCFAVHEIGHAIGIKIHGNPTLDVMQNNPKNWNGKLSKIDIAHVTELYPQPFSTGEPYA